MTSPSGQNPEAPRTATRPVLLAALLGGVLGAVLSFVLARTFPVVPPPPPPPPPPSEARQVVGELMQLLQTGQKDKFMKMIRPAFAGLKDEEFAVVCHKGMFALREHTATLSGPSVEFEFAREIVLSPSLVRVVYTEKFARGCLLWVTVVYNSSDGWQVVAFSVNRSDDGFSALQ
jgi:hypothetical protein